MKEGPKSGGHLKMKEKKHFFTLLKGLALDPITMEAPIMRPVEGLKISKGLKGV